MVERATGDQPVGAFGQPAQAAGGVEGEGAFVGGLAESNDHVVGVVAHRQVGPAGHAAVRDGDGAPERVVAVARAGGPVRGVVGEVR